MIPCTLTLRVSLQKILIKMMQAWRKLVVILCHQDTYLFWQGHALIRLLIRVAQEAHPSRIRGTSSLITWIFCTALAFFSANGRTIRICCGACITEPRILCGDDSCCATYARPCCTNLIGSCCCTTCVFISILSRATHVTSARYLQAQVIH
jgi:hypothetical protein